MRIRRDGGQGAADGLQSTTAAMSAKLSWDEFRLVKAIADSRSLAGAAELLGLNHSTVFRRLSALETTIGVRLFERSRSGYQPTAAGDEMIALATKMANSIVEFERRVAGRDAKPTGHLRVTTVEAIGQHFLPAILTQFQSQNPGVVIELILSNQPLNLSRRDADVAIRMTNDPPETLVGRRICAVRWATYCRCDLVAAYGSRTIEFRPVHRIRRKFRAGFGPEVDRGENPSSAAGRASEFDSQHAGADGSRIRGVVAALFPWRPMLCAGPGRTAAWRHRRRALDPDALGPATLGPCPCVHGLYRRGNGETSTSDRRR